MDSGSPPSSAASSAETTLHAQLGVSARHRPTWEWWLLALFATAVGGYGLALQDARPARDTVPGLPWLDEVHFVAGGLALIVGVHCFRRGLLAKAPVWHRVLGRCYIACALLGGIAGLLMAVYSSGGVPGHLGFLLLAVGWLVTTTLGWRAVHGRRFVVHRRWMVRSYALACAAISLRIELPLLLLATGSFAIAYPIVAWSCWIPNVLFAEWWLARTEPSGRRKLSRA